LNTVPFWLWTWATTALKPAIGLDALQRDPEVVRYAANRARKQ
jgi:hypothetical protein